MLITLLVKSVGYKNLTTATTQGFQSERIEGLTALASTVINGVTLLGSSVFSYSEEGSTTKTTYTVNETVAQIVTGAVSDVSINEEKAMEGDMVLYISPATVTSNVITGAWTRTVTMTLKTASGDTHSWYDATHASKASIADTSALGTATIPSTSVVFLGGIATKVITGSAHAWAGAETDTLTIASLTILGYTVTGGTSVETFA